eukprot:scaffold601_cov101-Isochrysis_galbana.AAC.1
MAHARISLGVVPRVSQGYNFVLVSTAASTFHRSPPPYVRRRAERTWRFDCRGKYEASFSDNSAWGKHPTG